MTLLKTNLNREDDVLRNKTLVNPRISNPTFLPPLPWNNTTLLKVAPYQVRNADKGKTIALAGSALYSLTFNRAAETYDSDFVVRVVNKDAWASSGRAKRIVSTDGDFATRFLWPGPPGQTVTVGMSNGTLGLDPAFERARLPGSTQTFFVRNGVGNDALGDGLDNGAGAWNTNARSYYNVANYFDFSSFPQSAVEIQMQANELSSSGAHLSMHALAPGAQGGAAIILNGNGAIFESTGANFELFHGVVLQIRNMSIRSVGNSGNISVNRGAYLYVLDGVEFQGNGGGADIGLSDGGRVEFNNSFTISGLNARTFFIVNGGGAIRVPSAINATLTIGQMPLYWVIGQDPGVTSLANVTWVNPGLVVGTQWFVSANHVLYKSATFPIGGIPGATSTGGQVI